jgi:hypothetical protein
VLTVVCGHEMFIKERVSFGYLRKKGKRTQAVCGEFLHQVPCGWLPWKEK